MVQHRVPAVAQRGHAVLFGRGLGPGRRRPGRQGQGNGIRPGPALDGPEVAAGVEPAETFGDLPGELGIIPLPAGLAIEVEGDVARPEAVGQADGLGFVALHGQARAADQAARGAQAQALVQDGADLAQGARAVDQHQVEAGVGQGGQGRFQGGVEAPDAGAVGRAMEIVGQKPREHAGLRGLGVAVEEAVRCLGVQAGAVQGGMEILLAGQRPVGEPGVEQGGQLQGGGAQPATDFQDARGMAGCVQPVGHHGQGRHVPAVGVGHEGRPAIGLSGQQGLDQGQFDHGCFLRVCAPATGCRGPSVRRRCRAKAAPAAFPAAGPGLRGTAGCKALPGRGAR